MSKREWVDETLEEMGVGSLAMDEFDDAILGITAETEPRVVYSEQRIIEILVADGCTEEEARDHYGFNVLGSIQPGAEYPVIVREYEP